MPGKIYTDEEAEERLTEYLEASGARRSSVILKGITGHKADAGWRVRAEKARVEREREKAQKKLAKKKQTPKTKK